MLLLTNVVLEAGMTLPVELIRLKFVVGVKSAPVIVRTMGGSVVS